MNDRGRVEFQSMVPVLKTSRILEEGVEIDVTESYIYVRDRSTLLLSSLCVSQ